MGEKTHPSLLKAAKLTDGIAAWFRELGDEGRRRLYTELSEPERAQLQFLWDIWARPEQLAPATRWRIWLICAGRGFGKTRAGAEWVRHIAVHQPEARIALVGASLAEVRAVMVEGESGILAISPPAYRPKYESSLRRLSWPNGAQAMLYSAAEPDSLRGPQHSHAWCDEIAKWDSANGRSINAWDNLMMGLRIGKLPQTLATTTPRAVALMRILLGQVDDRETILTRGTTYDNAANLPVRFVAAMQQTYSGTSLGRQELEGTILKDAEGALWSRTLLEKSRARRPAEKPVRIVVGVDPPVSATGDECGIIVAAQLEDGTAAVLADCSVGKSSPEQWARAVAETAKTWSTDRVIAEANQGGAMVGSVLRAAEISLPVRLVHASRGKVARAEPIAALYEAGRVHHAAVFPQLEDQLCGLMAGGKYEGPGRSPDRADALVWALHELMLGHQAKPRIAAI